jgi:prepilin-type N-terminal cleavage/methylation domain-containing protein
LKGEIIMRRGSTLIELLVVIAIILNPDNAPNASVAGENGLQPENTTALLTNLSILLCPSDFFVPLISSVTGRPN